MGKETHAVPIHKFLFTSSLSSIVILANQSEDIQRYKRANVDCYCPKLILSKKLIYDNAMLIVEDHRRRSHNFQPAVKALVQFHVIFLSMT